MAEEGASRLGLPEEFLPHLLGDGVPMPVQEALEPLQVALFQELPSFPGELLPGLPDVAIMYSDEEHEAGPQGAQDAEKDPDGAPLLQVGDMGFQGSDLFGIEFHYPPQGAQLLSLQGQAGLEEDRLPQGLHPGGGGGLLLQQGVA